MSECRARQPGCWRCSSCRAALGSFARRRSRRCRPEDHLARRELVPLLLRCRRHRGAPRHVPGVAARRSAAASDPRRRAGAERAATRTAGPRPCSATPAGTRAPTASPARTAAATSIRNRTASCSASTTSTRRPASQLHLADSAARRRRCAARSSRSRAAKRRTSTFPIRPAPPSASRSAAARWRPRRSSSRICSSSAWATASPRAKAIRTCRCAFRATAAPTTASAPATGDLTGYPARIGPWKQIGDKAFIQENARWIDQGCHRSLYSHQLRAALQLGLEDDHRAVTYVGVACSGSEVTFGLFLRYAGNEWVPNPPDMSQISAIAVGAVRRARGADAGSARGLSHGRDHPRAEGRPRAAQVRSDQCAQDRSHVRLRRRQRRRLLAPARQLGAVR